MSNSTLIDTHVGTTLDGKWSMVQLVIDDYAI